jgi:hypothetical protein
MKTLFNNIKLLLQHLNKKKTNNILLLVIYDGHKTSGDDAQRWRWSCENRKSCWERNCNTSTADRQRRDHCVSNKANAHVFPLTQWRQLHWNPEVWLRCSGKRPWSILRHNSGRCPAGMRKISGTYLEQFPGRESNSVYPAFEAPLHRRPCQRVCAVTHYSTASALLLINTYNTWHTVADVAFGNECPIRLDSSST